MLPQLLAERKQYLRGVPFNCLPVVKEDRVDVNSAVKHWSDDMAGAMDWVLKNNVLSVRNREKGIFDSIGYVQELTYVQADASCLRSLRLMGSSPIPH